ncbi:hypothetical protein DdX_19943 [Ditylenchus destructor]|uniref:Uncharacterized protein n=1 Tax=Ditylenchus destructor TaxID=166010 RepID=A0AAD4MI18_9BILA|nr:hypothetical protein DdX_19943 [Ditylenchus destructor]
MYSGSLAHILILLALSMFAHSGRNLYEKNLSVIAPGAQSVKALSGGAVTTGVMDAMEVYQVKADTSQKIKLIVAKNGLNFDFDLPDNWMNQTNDRGFVVDWNLARGQNLARHSHPLLKYMDDVYFISGSLTGGAVATSGYVSL